MKKIIVVVILAIIALSLTGCANMNALTGGDTEGEPTPTPLPPLTVPVFTDRAAFYKYYDQVKLSDNLAAITERFGEPSKEQLDGGVAYTWTFDDGYGIVTAMYDTGKVRAKLAYYADIRQLGPIAPGKSLDQLGILTKDFTYDMVVSTFGGPGLEIMQATTDASENPGVRRLYVWIDETDNMVQVLFDENGKLASASQGVLK